MQGRLVYKASFNACSFSCFALFFGVSPLCFFLSLTNNTHIFGLAQVISFAFDHFDY
jgi:hypothetical protein